MAFMGMRGTGDWVTDQRPKSWREMMLLLFPEGDMPLNAMLSKLPSEKVTDPEFYWWTKNLAEQGGPVTGIFTNASLTTAYTSGGVSGQNLFIRMADATASEFVKSKVVDLRDLSHPDMTVAAYVQAVVRNGASSYLAVTLLENDDNGSATDLSDCDWVRIIGSANAEGAPMPDSVAYDPVKMMNKCEIFRNSLEITRTAMETRLRTGDAYQESKRETLQYHGIEMERAMWWGVQSERIGENGKIIRTMDGIKTIIRQQAPGNYGDFTIDPAFNNDTWEASGEAWLDGKLEQLARWNTGEWMAFAGSGALKGINDLAKSAGQLNLQPESVSYGLKVRNWVTPFNTLRVMLHPLFSFDPIDRYTLAIVSMRDLKYRYITDTTFYNDDLHHGRHRLDGKSEEWLTECSLELHHPLRFMYLTGVGKNNILP